MGPKTTSGRVLGWPTVVAATFGVAVLPALPVYALRAEGLISSAMLAAVLAASSTLIVCQLASVYWERRRDSHDVLFGELMVWGWARRRLIERRLASATALFGAPVEGSEQLRPEQVEQRVKMLRRLANDLEASDPYTHGHSRRVARYASLIASRMHLSSAEVSKIRIAAALHDVGKINTPTEILHKPDRLTDEEFAVIKRHPGDGADMIDREVRDDDLVAIVRHHHERLDGTGYPNGLAGEEIPLGARIIAVADTFDAVTSARPYRRAKPHKVALDILRAESGTQLDPRAVQALCSVYFARRPLGVVGAGANLGGGLGSSLIGSVLNAVRIAAVVAAGGFGGAALLHPGAVAGLGHKPGHRVVPVQRLAFAARSGVVPRASSVARPSSFRSKPATVARPRTASPIPSRVTPQPVGGGSHTPTASPSPPSASAPPQNSGSTSGSHPTPTPGGGGLSVDVPSGSGPPVATVSANPTSPGSPGLTVSATAQPSKSSGASVTVVAKPAQPPSLSATVSAPQVPSLNITVGQP